MPNSSARDSKLPARVAAVVTLLMFLLGTGLLFHTAHDPILFGKYNLRVLITLGIWNFVFLPGVFFFTRFLLVRDEIKLRSGRRIPVTPWTKINATLIAALLLYIAVDALIWKKLVERRMTFAADVFHPYLQNSPRPHYAPLEINRWGFRGEQIEMNKPKGTFRVFVLGGSTVYCQAVSWEQSHVRLLEKRLRQQYPNRRIEVQNLGAEWHCSQHSLMKLLFEMQEYSPDLVVVFHAINDLARSFETDAYGGGSYYHDYRHYFGAVSNLNKPRSTIRWFIRTAGGHLFSDFRLQRVRLLGPEGKGINNMIVLFFPFAEEIEFDNWRSLPAFQRNMRQFVHVAQEKQYHVLLATQPSLYRDDLKELEKDVLIYPLSHQFQGKRASISSMRKGMAMFNDATRQIASQSGVRFVDLEALMPKTLQYMYDDVHYTPKGNELIADALAQSIITWGLLDNASPQAQVPAAMAQAAR